MIKLDSTNNSFLINNSFVHFSASSFKLIKKSQQSIIKPLSINEVLKTRMKSFHTGKIKSLSLSLSRKQKPPKMDAQYFCTAISPSSLLPSRNEKSDVPLAVKRNNNNNNNQQSIYIPDNRRTSDPDWRKQRRVSPRHVADSKKRRASTMQRV